MRSPLIVPALAAIASALLFLSFGFGLSGMPLVAYFVQLPLFFTGFAYGLSSATLASLGSAGMVLLIGGWTTGLAFLLIEAGPVLLIARLALLNRKSENSEREWYPPGLLLVRLVFYTLVISALALIAIWYAGSGIENAFENGIKALAVHMGATSQTAPMVALLRDYASYIPGIVALSWIIMVVVNAALGQLLAVKTGHALRPSPNFGDLWLPAWCMPALAVVFVLSFIASENAAYLANTALVLLALPFLFLGLAVVHKFVARLGKPSLMLSILYISLILFSWPLVLVLVALGLLEERLQFRRRFA